MSDRVSSLYNSMLPVLAKIDNVRCTEKALYSDALQVAGTVDCVADFDGVPCVIDFKNSRKPKPELFVWLYYLQATAYSIMYEERMGEKIENIAIIIGVWDQSPQVYMQKKAGFVDALEDLLYRFSSGPRP